MGREVSVNRQGIPHLGHRSSRSATMRALAKYRVWVGMTQIELEGASGYSQQTLSCWERGDTTPKISAIEDIAQALGLRVALVDDRGREVTCE